MLWREASIALRPVDNNLAAYCWDKAEYWSAPENWENVQRIRGKDPDIEMAILNVDAVYASAQELLQG